MNIYNNEGQDFNDGQSIGSIDQINIVNSDGAIVHTMSNVVVPEGNAGHPFVISLPSVDDVFLVQLLGINPTAGGLGGIAWTEISISNMQLQAGEQFTNDAPEVYPFGETVVTWTVTDIYGNESNCTQTVTVIDSEAPTAICQSISITLDQEGNTSIIAEDVDFGSNDNCTGVSFELSQTTFTCEDLGENEVTLTVTDENGNASTCIAIVTVVDNTAPEALCQNYTVSLDENGIATIDVEDIDAGSNDECGIASMELNITEFNCENVGENTVSLTVIDNSGNESSCDATVTIEDNTAPTYSFCPEDQSVSGVAGACLANVTWMVPDVDDNCAALPPVFTAEGASIIVIGNQVISSFPSGTTEVTMWVSDVNGNEVSCTFNITVTDNEPPIIVNCPEDITVNNDEGECGANVVFGPVGASDNCPGVVLETTSGISIKGGYFDIGETEVVFTATDVNGLQTVCSFTVTVIDTEPAELVCPIDLLVSTDQGECHATVLDLGEGEIIENCEEGELTNDAPEIFEIGTTVVTWEFVDGGGNISSCSQNVTVEDKQAPTPDMESLADIVDECGANLDAPTATDNCDGAITATTDDPTEYTVAGTYVVTWTYTDSEGNISTQTQNVTIEDNTAPTALCMDATLILDDEGNAVLDPAMIDNGSFDECSEISLSVDQTAFDCGHVGTNEVTLIVSNEAGIESTCTAVVTVVDDTAPLAVCSDITIQLDSEGTATIDADQIGSLSSDACGITMSLSQTEFDCTMIGENSVTLTVTDTNGNSAECTSIVTITGDGAPTAVCQDIEITLNENGFFRITPSMIDGGSTGSCEMLMSIDQSDFDCDDLGDNSVTLTVTDSQGNSSTCKATVTVVDDTAPELFCADIVVTLDEDGFVEIPADFLQEFSGGDDPVPTSFDACGYTLSASQTVFDCSHLGENEVILTATDDSGNSSTCISTVTILDETAPVLGCQNISVELGPDGFASIDAEELEGVIVIFDSEGPPIEIDSYDACGYTLTASLTEFTCENLGENSVILTATDGSGNESTCEAIVTVLDVTAPEFYCADITVELGSDGLVEIDPSELEGFLFIEDELFESFDACGFTVSASQTSFDCSNIGENSVTVTATDASGNSTECVAIVTVTDEMPAEISCMDITIELDEFGQASIEPEALYMGSELGACGYTFTADQTDFTCEDLGENTVTITAMDDAGNTSSCTATVTVEDNLAPEVFCADLELELGTDGIIEISPESLEDFILVDGEIFVPASFDNCGYTLTASQTTFTCEDLGDNEVVLTATDGSGNMSTCVATVTVIDFTAPVVSCMKLIVVLDENGVASIDPSDFDDGSTDACEMTFTATQTEFDCNDIGNIPITVTVTDANGNSASCMTDVMVIGDPCEPIINEDDDPEGYCESMGLSTDDEWIHKVRYRDINNTSGDDGGYADYTNLSTDAGRGNSSRIYLKAGYSGAAVTEYWRVWIDFNQDGEFHPVTEKVAQRRGKNQVWRWVTIPDDALLGETTMRVSMKEGAWPSPCETFANGEVEDYTINIVDFADSFVEIENEDESMINTDVNTEEELDLDTEFDLTKVNEDLEVTLYPNPSYTETYLKIESPSSFNLEMSIYDHLGRLVVVKQPIDGELTMIDVSAFVPGKYFMKLSGSDGVIVKNFIVLSN